MAERFSQWKSVMMGLIETLRNCETRFILVNDCSISFKLHVDEDIIAVDYQHLSERDVTYVDCKYYPNGNEMPVAKGFICTTCRGCSESFDVVVEFIKRYIPDRPDVLPPINDGSTPSSLEPISTMMMELNKRLSRLEQAYYNYALPESR